MLWRRQLVRGDGPPLDAALLPDCRWSLLPGSPVTGTRPASRAGLKWPAPSPPLIVPITA